MRPTPLRRRHTPVIALVALLAVAALPAHAAAEGTDLEFGGPGSDPGQFAELRDLTCDAAGNPWTLEGLRYDERTKAWSGNGRVQQFDRTGKPLRQFALRDPALARQDPQRIAIDSAGVIAITDPAAGLVMRFAADGKPLGRVALPRAMAIAVWRRGGKECFAVMAGEGDAIVPLGAAGSLEAPVPLGRRLERVQDLAADRAGNLYVLADINQIHQFDASGRLLTVLGAGQSTRADDGSELVHSVAVDGTGAVYGMGWGNPGPLVRFSPDLGTVALRGAQFKWADPWGPHSHYTPLAIDHQDRVWAAATHVHDPQGPNFRHYRAVPAVMRVATDFHAVDQNGTTIASTLGLGVKPELVVPLPHGVGYELQPVPIELVLKAATRRIAEVQVSWRLVDMHRREIQRGASTLALTQGAEARHAISVTPPRHGWYMLTCDLAAKGQPLASISRFFGITRRYPGMVALDATIDGGGATNPFRQAFAGLMNHRLHAVEGTKALERLDRELEASRRAGMTLAVQLSDKKDCASDLVRTFVERYKGKVAVWEVMNEPNFTFANPADYVATLRAAHAVIKQVDPAAQVMGPNVCGIDLGWYEAFFTAGGGKLVDILSIHDYEGHETIDPEHWRWKLGALRALMARHGASELPIWQTERAISGVRGNNWLGSTQAVRMGLHRDLLASLGIPSEHNNHYYVNDHGFGDCPSWIWSASGPHPAAFALRVRHAMTAGRAFRGTLDAGPVGERLLLALRYAGDDGSTIVLRNLGSLDLPLDLAVSGGTTVEQVDAFGNAGMLKVENGRVRVVASQMATYLRLAKGQEVRLPRLDFGRNLAPRATIACSVPADRDGAALTNGVWETINAGGPHGGTDGKAIWSADAASLPLTVDIAFAQPRPLDALVVHGLHADNAFCALLDYDLQWRDGTTWRTIEEVRVPCPPSEPGRSVGATTNTWYLDHNVYLHRFAPVTTDRLRLVVRRVTNGFVPDDKARAWGKVMPARLMLREIEIFGPTGDLQVDARFSEPVRRAAFSELPLAITARNAGNAAAAVTARVLPPAGWTATPGELPLRPGATTSAEGTVTLVPPAEIPTGSITIDVALLDAKGMQVDLAWATLDVVSPLVIAPQPPPSIDAKLQPLVLSIRNTGERPASGTVRVECLGPKALAPIERPFGPLAPGAAATIQVEVPGLALTEGAWSARWRVCSDRLLSVAVQDLAVRAWSVLGPFANDFERDFGPERVVDLAAVFKDQVGIERRWRVASTGPDGLLDFSALFTPRDNVCAYAVAWVKSPEARPALLSLGSDDGAKAWVNGRQVHAENGSHAAVPGQTKVPVELVAGWNQVLFKVMQGGGGWGMYCTLLSPSGAPLADLVWAPAKP